MNIINGDNEDLRLNNKGLSDENKKLKEELRKLNQKNTLMQTEINKYHLLKELLSKGINTESEDFLGFKSKNYKGRQLTLDEVVRILIIYFLFLIAIILNS